MMEDNNVLYKNMINLYKIFFNVFNLFKLTAACLIELEVLTR